MTRSVARVDQRITVSAANSASDAIEQAKASLDKYANSTAKVRAANERANAAIRRAAAVRKSATERTKAAAAAEKKAARDINEAAKATERAARATDRAGNAIGKAGATAKGAFDHGLPGLQGKHDSFNRLAAAAGGAGGALQESAHGIALVDAAMRLLPGPIGAAVASITAIGAAAFAVNKHLSETRAQLRLLGGADVAELGDGLQVGTQAAIKLSQALADLPDQGLKPSIELLAQVKENAESIGKEGTAALTAFAAAIAKGPEALRKFQAEFGRLGAAFKTLPDLAKDLGLDPTALGIAQKITDQARRQKEARAALLRIQAQTLEYRVAAAAESKAEQAATEASTGFQSTLANIALDAAREKTEQIRKQLQAERQLVTQIQAEADATRSALNARALAAARVSVIEATAAAEKSKGFRLLLKEEASLVRSTNARRALRDFDKQHVGDLTAALALERSGLEIQVLQARSAKNANAAARRSAAREASDRARAARAAATEARLRIATAQIDRDGLRTQTERIKLLELQRQKELQATGSVRGRKARALARLAIDEDYATKRAALERELAAATGKTSATLAATLEGLDKRRAATAATAASERAKTAKTTQASIAASFRARGDIESAELVELRQARADYAAAVIKIDADLVKSNQNVNADSVEAADLAIAADAKRLRAKLALEAVENKIGRAKEKRGRDEVARMATEFGSAASSVGGKFGAAATSAAASTAKIAKSWKGLAGSSPDVITAIGGVAAATVDGEQAKHAILAISETGAAIASAAIGDYKGAALHGAAAVVYGASAAGIIGGDSGSTAAGGGGAFADQAASTQAAGGSGGASAGVTVINNFNQPLATQQQIGRASINAIRSAGRTGHAQSAGV